MWTSVDSLLEALAKQFWSKVDQTGEHWAGPRQYEFRGIVQPSRRWAWMLDRQTFLREGQDVAPCPIQKACLNPAHLFTDSELMARFGDSPSDKLYEQITPVTHGDLMSITNAPKGKQRGEGWK